MIYSRFAKDRTTGLSINANGNYSVTPEDFILKPGATEIFNVTRMIFSLSDSGTISSGGWGAGSALTNGLKLEVWKGGKASGTKILDLFDDLPIKQNGQWGAVCYDVGIIAFGGGDDWLHSRYTFTRDTNKSEGIILDGYNGDELVIPLNDDFTGLVSQQFRFGVDLK